MTIDEKYLQRAINIRRTYLKFANNMDLYKARAKQVSDKLNETVKKLEDFGDEIGNSKNVNEKEAFEKLLKIIDEVDEEGKRLQKLIDPFNEEIEKLAKEEMELYRQIVENNKNLTEEQIVKIVRDRLIEEGLS